MTSLQPIDQSLSEPAKVALHYVLSHSRRMQCNKLPTSALESTLRTSYPLFRYLFDGDKQIEDAIRELSQSETLANPEAADQALVRRLSQAVHDHIRHYSGTIADRVPLGHIYAIAESQPRDENVDVLNHRLQFRENYDLIQAVPISKQYTHALMELHPKGDQQKNLVMLLAESAGLGPLTDPPKLDEPNVALYWFHANCFLPERLFQVAFVVLNDEADHAEQLALADRLVGAHSETNFGFLILGHPNSLTKHLWNRLECTHGFVLDERDLKRIALSRNHQHCVRECVIPQLPPSMASPFKYQGPVTGDCFFGREREIRRILDTSRANYCILGPRKVGKSSLLQTIEQRVNLRNSLPGMSAVYIDATGDSQIIHFQRKLMTKLVDAGMIMEWVDPGEHFFEDLGIAIRQSGRKHLFLIDEVDYAVRDRRFHGFEEFARSISNEGYARFVVAGYRALRNHVTSRSSPFYNLFEEITLGPLADEEARNLVGNQMERAFVKFENGRVIDAILNLGSTLPSYIQCMCHLLLVRLDALGRRRTITEDDVPEVYNGEDFTREITQAIEEYSDPEFKLLERLVVYWAADHESDQFTEQELWEGLGRTVCTVRFTDMREALHYLTSTYILGMKNGKYSFRVPQLKEKIRKAEPDMAYVINNLAEQYRQT